MIQSWWVGAQYGEMKMVAKLNTQLAAAALSNIESLGLVAAINEKKYIKKR